MVVVVVVAVVDVLCSSIGSSSSCSSSSSSCCCCSSSSSHGHSKVAVVLVIVAAIWFPARAFSLPGPHGDGRWTCWRSKPQRERKIAKSEELRKISTKRPAVAQRQNWGIAKGSLAVALDKNNLTQRSKIVWHSEACGKIRGASLSLRRGRTGMNDMFDRLKDHPLAVGSDGKSNFLYGKANPRSAAHQHESVYKIKLTTVLGFDVIVGCSCHKDPRLKSGQTTHDAWVPWHHGCLSGLFVPQSGSGSMQSICC